MSYSNAARPTPAMNILNLATELSEPERIEE